MNDPFVNDLFVLRSRSWRLLAVAAVAAALMLSLWSMMAEATVSTPIDVGYLDFSYGATVKGEPTAEKPESKLWWNDGYWWGILYNDTASMYHIYKLNWNSQEWEDTGVAVDERSAARADVLWDGSKLYVLSHFGTAEANHTSNDLNRGRLYRFSYDAATETYSLDNPYVNINEDETEALVLDKDSTGRLWATYVSRGVTPDQYEVHLNTSTTGDLSWGTPFVLSVTGDMSNTQRVSADDISSLVTFSDTVGVMWSNQLTDTNHFYFATHDVTDPPSMNWTLEYSSPITITANDHINMATSAAGHVFAAIKTSNPNSTDSGIGLLARDTDGTFSFHELSEVGHKDTRPIVVVNDDENKVYMFVVSSTAGGRICFTSATITSPLSNLSFAESGNCTFFGTSSVPVFIGDTDLDNISNPTSIKPSVNMTTGLVVLASDDVNNQVYVHNVLGNPPPVVAQRSPGINEVDVAAGSVVMVTFSKDMNASTIDGSSFTVWDGVTPVPGTVTYDSASRTAVFTPTVSFGVGVTYTARLSDAIEDTGGQTLFGSTPIREEWSFTMAPPTVQFSLADYSVNENASTATITVTLNTASSSDVIVDYATSDGTAVSPGDYTAIVTTPLTITAGLTSATFDVTIINDLIDEPNESLNLTLSNPNGATLGTPAASTLTIIDNDGTPTVQFSNPNYLVNEADGTATIEVTLSHPSASVITVNYATSDGTAVNPDDYTAASGPLTFNPGETSQTFDVTIVNDTLAELDQTINLMLSSPINADLGTPNPAVLTIVDDEPTPTVAFEQSQFTVNEGAGTIGFNVILSAVSDADITVEFTTVDGTAVAGSDFTAASDTLTFAAGQTSKPVNVTVTDDALDEAPENFQIALSNPSGADLGTIASTTVNITDNDGPPTVQFSSANFTANEGDKAVITVELSTASGQSVAVDYAASDGSATSPDDYQAVNDTLVFAPGETSKTFEVMLTAPEGVIEPAQTVLLTLSNPDDATLGSPSLATLTIVDSDGVLIYLPVVLRN